MHVGESDCYLSPSTICQNNSNVVPIKFAPLEDNTGLTCILAISDLNMTADRYGLDKTLRLHRHEDAMKSWLVDGLTIYNTTNGLDAFNHKDDALHLTVNRLNLGGLTISVDSYCT